MGLRLLSANVCFISPPANVRRSVHIGLITLVVEILLLCMPAFRGLITDNIPVASCLAAYWLIGQSKVQSTTLTLGLFSLSLLDVWLFPKSRYIINSVAILGYIWAAIGPFGLVVGMLMRYFAPNFVFDAQKQRLDQFKQVIANGAYDVVVLQEVSIVFGFQQILNEIVDAGSEAGLRYFASSGRWAALPANSCTSGLVVLSRYPIAKSCKHTFSQQAWFEWSFVQRGALMVEIKPPSGPAFAVLNIHVSPGGQIFSSHLEKCKRDGKYSNPLGMDQILEVMGPFLKFAEKAEHKIIAGDFNVCKSTRPFKVIKCTAEQQGLVDMYPDCPATFGCTDEPRETLLTGVGDAGNPGTYDHVFSNRKNQKCRVEKMAAPEHLRSLFQQVSDHRGVEVYWENSEPADLANQNMV